MRFIAYRIEGPSVELRPAPVARNWMDATEQRYAYRCLPLNIANSHGWEIISPSTFTAIWDGEKDCGSIRIMPTNDGPQIVESHFGHGIITFEIPYLFRTDAGVDLFVSGPMNSPKDAVYALSGIVETDWAPFTFTVNWMFTRRSTAVTFKKGEPLCHVFPIQRGFIEKAVPIIRDLADDRALEGEYLEWSKARVQHNSDLQANEPADWQKHYFRGTSSNGRRPMLVQEHKTRLQLRNFVVGADRIPEEPGSTLNDT